MMSLNKVEINKDTELKLQTLQGQEYQLNACTCLKLFEKLQTLQGQEYQLNACTCLKLFEKLQTLQDQEHQL